MIKRLFPPRCLPSRVTRLLYDIADAFCFALVFFAILSAFVLRPSGVSGASMEPTLRDGQYVLLFVAGDARHGDIVVVSEKAMRGPNSSVLVKRVIGLPGDVIDIDFDAGTVFRNGEALDEPYIAQATQRRGDVAFPVAVEEGTIFVLGDNRNHSADSRDSNIGLIDQRYLIGRVIF